MPELILLSSIVMGMPMHTHNMIYDPHSGRNIMSPDITMLHSTAVDQMTDLRKIVQVFGDNLHECFLTLRPGFWSLEELKEWVRTECTSDLYFRLSHGEQFEIASTNFGDIAQIKQRVQSPPCSTVSIDYVREDKTEITKWVEDNCTGRRYSIDSYIDNMRGRITYYFQSPDDEMLFRVRWTGTTEALMIA